jgi:hypothetical protein
MEPSPRSVEISVVIPVYRTSEFLGELYGRLQQVLTPYSPFYEILFVEDACPANSLATLRGLAKDDPAVAPTLHAAGTIFAASASYTPPAVSDLDPACGTTSVTLNTSGATYPLSSAVGTYRFCNVKLESNSQLVVSGAGQITVHVRDDFIIRNTASIESVAPIRFVIGKALEIQTSMPLGINYSSAASWKDPRKLKFDLASSGSNTVKLTAPSGGDIGDPSSPTLRLYGRVYAPSRLLEVTGSGRVEVYGSLIGARTKLSSGDLEIHNPLEVSGTLPGLLGDAPESQLGQS